MSYEDRMLGRIDRTRNKEKRNETIDAAHVEASRILNSRDYAIQATDFIDLYGRDNVLNDMRKVKAKELLFERTDTPEKKEAKKASEVFEAIAIQNAELSNWLGENVSVLKTSRFDDYFRGTDMVAEWQTASGESQVLALAVDLTFGKDAAESKMYELKRKIDAQDLTSIKYFTTADGSFRGERSGIPRVVIGVDKDSLIELSRLWLMRDHKALAAHPAQRVLVDEIHEQLTAIQGYADSRGLTRVSSAYGKSLSMISDLSMSKRSIDLAHMQNDRVYNEIIRDTRSVFHS